MKTSRVYTVSIQVDKVTVLSGKSKMDASIVVISIVSLYQLITARYTVVN